jgi:hypothetical protein
MSQENSKKSLTPSQPTNGQSKSSRREIEHEKKIAQELTMLAVSRGVELSNQRLDLYLADLVDLPVEPLLEAIRKWRRSGSQFFPQVPELRELVSGPVQAEAEVAWNQVVAYVQGGYWHPDEVITL